MADTFYTQWTPSTLNAEFNHEDTLVTEVGDLLWYDSADSTLKPASSFTDAGTAVSTQKNFVALFAGLSNSKMRVTDTTQRKASLVTDVVVDYPCASATFAVGDYVTPTWTAGVLSDQQVTKTTDPSLAIGRVVKEYTSATTKVKVRMTSRLFSGLLLTEHDLATAGGTVTISNGDGSTNLIPARQQLGATKAAASHLLASFNTTNDATVCPSLNLLKSGSGVIGSNTIVASGEVLGEINFFGADGVDFESPAAQIQVAVDTTPGAGDMPGRIVFLTTADSGETLTEAMRIDSAQMVTAKGSFAAGSNATDRVTIKGFYMTPANVSVAVPSITDPDIARVQVDVSSAFSIQPAVGDVVIAIPQEALPTNARLQGAWVYQTDGVEITFGSEGGNVTGASKNFKFLVIDLT